jgi:GntR family transcriptional regulator
MVINKLPLFKRLAAQLSNIIAATPAGDRLPSEPVLAKQLGVSRATLREAMRAFEGQGLLRRRQGIGTFVVGRQEVIESGLEVLESIETLAQRIGLPVRMGDLGVDQVAADLDEVITFGVEPDSRLIQVARTLWVENRPVAYLIDRLPADVITPEELRNGFTGSVLDLLLRRGSPALGQSRTEIRAVAASTEIARPLEIQRGDVLLCFIADLYTQTGRMIDRSFSYFLPGFFRFHVVRSVGSIQTVAWTIK